MDNGLELTADGYVLHPKRAAYRIALVVGLVESLLGLFIVGTVVSSSLTKPASTGDARLSALVLAGAVALFCALLTAVGWFTSLPPTLTVSRDGLTLLGGAHRRRVGRSHITDVSRSLGTRRDKTYFLALDNDRRAIEIPVRHFDPGGLEEAMRRLGVPLDGDFTA